MKTIFVNPYSNMVGAVMTKISGKVGDDSMIFFSEKGQFNFFHSKDCCESVLIEDICGDIDDLIGSPILYAEEVSNARRQNRLVRLSNNDTFTLEDLDAEVHTLKFDAKTLDEPAMYGSYTWTFYRFATAKGCVTVRWLGTSNGYYSEHVYYSEGLLSRND